MNDRPGDASDVTVVITTYNAATFVERALQSVMDQTSPPREVIVVDDASTDDTVSVVHRFTERLPTSRLVCLEHNVGPSRARNTGIREASGRWIAILDADDAFHKDRLETLMGVAERSGAGLVTDNQILYDIDAGEEVRIGFVADWATKPLTLQTMFDNDLPGRSPLGFALLKPLVKASVLRDHAIQYDESERNGEDFKFTTDLLFAGVNAVLTSYAGYIYSTRIGGISHKSSKATRSVARFDRLVELSDSLESKYGHLIDDQLRASIRRRRRYLHVIHASNVAREYRTSGRLFSYLAFVMRRPALIALLLRRVVDRVAVMNLHRRVDRATVYQRHVP